VDSHAPFDELFFSVSILGNIVMSFKDLKDNYKHLFIKGGTCVAFTGEVRYAWLHGIACRKLDKVQGELNFRRRRISLTFRRVRKVPKCNCK